MIPTSADSDSNRSKQDPVFAKVLAVSDSESESDKVSDGDSDSDNDTDNDNYDSDNNSNNNHTYSLSLSLYYHYHYHYQNSFTVGSTVVFEGYSGSEVEFGDKEFMFVKVSDILAVLE